MITWHDEDPEGSAGEEARLDTAGDAVRDGEHRGELTHQRRVSIIDQSEDSISIIDQSEDSNHDT